MFNSGPFPAEPPNANLSPTNPTNPAQPQVPRNHAATGMLAFVTYPRVFDMFRPTDGGTTRTIRVLNTADTFVATFSPSKKAAEGEGTFVTKGTPLLTNCVVTYNTRLEAGKLYHQRVRTGRNGATNQAVQAAFPVLTPNGIAPVAANVPQGGTTWSYRFDNLLRVLSVQPRGGWINVDNIGDRDDDSPEEFQSRFSEIMRATQFAQADASHLVAGSQKPPNWFFNYVPQSARSNQANQAGGCWFYTENAARALQRLGCSITYNMGLTYPATTAGGGTRAACNAHFRPTKMSLDLRIIGGTGSCATMRAEWACRSLVTYDAATRELKTTRLMAHTLHRAVFAAASTDLRGLLLFATTSVAVNQCDAETGAIYAFARLKLTPKFAQVALVRGSTCLASRTVDVTNAAGAVEEFHLLAFDATACKYWATDATGPPDDLTDDSGECLTMVQVPGVGNVNVATITPASNGGCLKFIYEFDPFAALPAAAVPPAPPVAHKPPTSGMIETTTPGADLTRPVYALLTGLIGTLDGMSGEMEECLVWDALNQVFMMVDGLAGQTHADCVRV